MRADRLHPISRMVGPTDDQLAAVNGVRARESESQRAGPSRMTLCCVLAWVSRDTKGSTGSRYRRAEGLRPTSGERDTLADYE